MDLRQKVADFLDRIHPANLLYSTYEQRLLANLDRDRLPHHVAVLADGNRRWARMNAPGEPLVTGYRAGADRLEDLVQWCSEVGIEVVTLWVLSTDNLKRSKKDELIPLLWVIVDLVERLAESKRGPVQIVGDLTLLPEDVATRLQTAADSTTDLPDGDDKSLHVNVAVAYGGRHELRDAVRELLSAEASKGATLEEVAQSLEIDQIADYLYTRGQPDPDLLIRTSGEQRLSGFMMWQSAHSELYFCEALWPDFRKVDFYRALRSYSQRERRYGH